MFVDYLKVAIPKGASDKTCYHYTNALSGRIMKYAKTHIPDFKNIFELDFREAIKLLETLSKNEELIEKNKRDHNVFLKAFGYYTDFVNCYQETKKTSEVAYQITAQEGESYECHHTEYKRNKAVRESAAKRDNYTCRICGFDFVRTYGEVGNHFIEVHHKDPVKDGTRETKLDDLISVCPNCHSMLHKKNPPLLPEVLKLYIELANNNEIE